MSIQIDASRKHYRELNEQVYRLWGGEEDKIILSNVNGQRYIGNSLPDGGQLEIYGVPGNDLAMFMDGASIEVFSNVQDSAANTMNSGLLVVHGSAGDTLGYGMRGGEVFVRDNAGYRCGIHMKEYREQVPMMIIGGAAGCFLGEYMAGGVIIVLNLDGRKEPVGPYCGSGMHGGIMYIRGPFSEQSFKDVRIESIADADLHLLRSYAERYTRYFSKPVPVFDLQDFKKVIPAGNRPYHRMYYGV